MSSLADERGALVAAARAACDAIPPAFTLAANVAVNPYLGQAEMSLAQTGALLARVAGARVTPPRSWVRGQIARGVVTDADIAAAAAAAGSTLTVEALKEAVAQDDRVEPPLPTVADLAAEVSGIDWPGLIAERFGAWAGAYMDEGQALWAAPHARGAFAEWRAVATHDLTPEIAGLAGFAAFVADAPDKAADALLRAARRLGISPAAMPSIAHRLLMTLGGWAQMARGRAWEAARDGGQDHMVFDVLAIRLLWEEALFTQYEPALAARWAGIVAAHAADLVADSSLIENVVLQEAYERASARTLVGLLREAAGRVQAAPVLQAAFCIDVRSEPFRRALESLDPGIETLGFAGFFGEAVAHQRFASDVVERRLPVLLAGATRTVAGGPADRAADKAARIKARAVRAWGRFKLAAVSSFAFVESAGLVYAAKLLRDALGVGHLVAREPAPHPVAEEDLAHRVATAAGILRAMSLTSRFAPLVLIVGHGARLVNNPHASALQCGACGGYSGEVNARLLAALLNDAAVRGGLAAAGIAVPAGTLFVAALHDTVSDQVSLFTHDAKARLHREAGKRAAAWLAAAGVLARRGRALPHAAWRGRDWAEIRPEWGLAGCRWFIAAPRARTRGLDLQGRGFLHDYDWEKDTDFSVLELILTAPVVVASWISLQYYGSSVSPEIFGGGNKLLHNVTGGVGVVEGNGGVLRAGLPFQSVHDGEELVHAPLRLTVCVAAPSAAISGVLERHPAVRALFDQRWMHLLALGEGKRYAGGLAWEKEDLLF